MNDRGLPLQISVFNILLSREVRSGKPRNALAMYSALKGMDFMFPDAFTFGSLFTLYRGIRPRIMRKLVPTPESTHLIPLRQLYSEFIDATQRTHFPVEMTTSLLSVALRAFLRQRDYAGAFVILGTFSYYRLPLDHHTYYVIMKHLVGRIWIETTIKRLLSPQPEVKWSDRFLGVDNFKDVKLGEDLVHHIFFLISRKQFELDAPLHPLKDVLPSKYDDRGKYRVPTMEMMQSVDTPDPQDFKYHVVPLKRLLRRAILANLSEDGDFAEGKKGVSAAVAEAKKEMIPDYQTWEHYVFSSSYNAKD